MMEIGELISFYRRQSGMTIDELAEKSGVAKGTLNKIMGGVTKAPTLDNMKAIAKALGKRLADFDDEPEFADMFSPSEQAHIKKYRLLDPYGKEAVDGVLNAEYRRYEQTQARAALRAQRADMEAAESAIIKLPFRCSLQSASAGTGTYLGPEAFKTIYVQDNHLTQRASFGVPVSGNSMEPRYHDGDILILDGAEEIGPGEIGVFSLDGEGYVKELGKGELISLNSAYDNIPLAGNIRCHGRVIGVLDPEWIVEE